MIASPGWIRTLLCAAALLGAGGCGGDTQEPAPAPESPAAPMPSVQRPAATPPAPAPTPAAPLATTSNELPSSFPKDVPLHADSRVTIARVAPDQSMAVSFEVAGGNHEAVGSYYADSLAAEGWTTTLHEDADGKLIFALKEDRNVTIVVRPGEGVALVDIVVAELP